MPDSTPRKTRSGLQKITGDSWQVFFDSALKLADEIDGNKHDIDPIWTTFLNECKDAAEVSRERLKRDG